MMGRYRRDIFSRTDLIITLSHILCPFEVLGNMSYCRLLLVAKSEALGILPRSVRPAVGLTHAGAPRPAENSCILYQKNCCGSKPVIPLPAIDPSTSPGC